MALTIGVALAREFFWWSALASSELGQNTSVSQTSIPLAAFTHCTRSETGRPSLPSTADVKERRPSLKTGEDHPFPGSGVFQTTLLLALHLTGKFLAEEIPWPVGPRNWGHASWAPSGLMNASRNVIANAMPIPDLFIACDVSSSVPSSTVGRPIVTHGCFRHRVLVSTYRDTSDSKSGLDLIFKSAAIVLWPALRRGNWLKSTSTPNDWRFKSTSGNRSQPDDVTGYRAFHYALPLQDVRGSQPLANPARRSPRTSGSQRRMRCQIKPDR